MSGGLFAGEILSLAAHSGPGAGSAWARAVLQSGLLPPAGPIGVVLLAVSGAAFARSLSIVVQADEDA
eukprot:6126603-Prymnesium_polylepis.1